jgi:hypothetical protein
MLATIRRRQRFRKSRRFIIDPPRTNRMDVPSIRLRLRVDQRVSIDFGSTREDKTYPRRLRQAEHLMCSERAHLGRLNRRVCPANLARKSGYHLTEGHVML